MVLTVSLEEFDGTGLTGQIVSRHVMLLRMAKIPDLTVNNDRISCGGFEDAQPLTQLIASETCCSLADSLTYTRHSMVSVGNFQHSPGQITDRKRCWDIRCVCTPSKMLGLSGGFKSGLNMLFSIS